MNNKISQQIVFATFAASLAACGGEDPLAVAPPAPQADLRITDVIYPQAVSAGQEIEVKWSAVGFSDQAVHRLTWFEIGTDNQTTSVPASVTGPNAHSARFVAPTSAGSVGFIIQGTNADGSSVASNQFNITVTVMPDVQIISAPSQVDAGDAVAVQWRFNGTSVLTSNVIRWGTTSGQYTQNSLGGRLAGSGVYADEFTAPSDAEKIFFMVQVVDADGVYTSAEQTITVNASSPTITIDAFPPAVQASQSIEIRWSVDNASALSENRIFWGTQSGQLTSVSSLGQATGNNAYLASFTAPATPGTIFFVVRASDQSGSFESTEAQIQVQAGPAVMVSPLPQSTITEATQEVRWSVTGVSNVSSTVLEWGTSAGNYSNTVQGVLDGNQYSASFLTPAVAGQTVYLRAVAFHAQGRTESIEHQIQLTQSPNVTIESAPSVAQTTADIEIVWSFTDALAVTQNVIRWGTAPGTYTNEVAPQETLATNRYRTVFPAPTSPQVIYFVAEITDSRGSFQSVEQSITVGGAPSIELIRAPRLGVAAQVLEVEWRLNNMGGITNNNLRWGPIPNVFLYTVNNVTSLGGNRYVARFAAPVSGGLVSLQIRATDSQGSHRSSTHNIVIIPTPAIQFQSLPNATQASQPLTLTWQVSNVSNIDRQFISWGYTSGQLSNQTSDAVANGNDYTASIPVPSQYGTLYFAVNIVTQSSTVSSGEIEIEVVPGAPVSLPDTQTGISITSGDEHYYSFPITAGTRYEVTMTPDISGGDVDLYVSQDAALSTTNYECRPYNSGTQAESCAFTATQDGYAHILIDGFEDGVYDLETVVR